MTRVSTTLFLVAATVLLGLSGAAFAADRVVNVKVRADSEYPRTEAFKAMDGNRGTTWFTKWRRPVPELPHEIVVDLGATYEITGFTYVPKVDKSPVGAIKGYEAYFAEKDMVLRPLAENVGKPVAKGTFEKPVGDNVVKFPAPVKGRYFRLRALSEATGKSTCSGVAELILHCEGVKFVAQPWSLRVNYPKVGADAIGLIEGFPLLGRLLELSDPWNWDAMALKEQLIPEGMEPFPGSGDPAAVFINRRAMRDWRKVKWKEAATKRPTDSPGLKVWDHHAFETDYYALASARPLIRLHLGRPLLTWVNNMKVLYPKLPESARGDLLAKMDRIVAALKPYGAKKLPMGLRTHRYLLPGGTKMTISDHIVDAKLGSRRDACVADPVRLKIDFEPATPPKGRETLPFLVAWRRPGGRRQGQDGPPGVVGRLGRSAAGAPAPVTAGVEVLQWPDRPTGFASVDAMGQNGTTGGAGGKVVTVTTQAELEKYAQMKEPYVIRVKGAIKITEKKNPRTRYEKLTTKEVHVASDKTIVGVGKTAEIVNGGFFLGPGTHNVILRNMKIHGTYVKGDWSGLTNDYDGLQMDTAHHVWIDHCHFTRHGDGCIDGRAGTTYVTLSWTIMSDHNKTFGIGWDTEAKTSWTVHHNWFRNVACRTGGGGQVLRVHLYNNYWLNVGVIGPGANNGTNLVFQNNHLVNVRNPLTLDPHSQYGPSTVVATGNIYRKVHGRKQTGGTAFYDPSKFYPYTLDEAEDIPGILAKFAGPQENIGK